MNSSPSYRKYATILAGSLLAIVTAAGLGSCGKSDDSTSGPRSYVGAGSQWNVTLGGDNTFTITHLTAVGGTTDMTVNGTYAVESTGFLLLTVSSATGTNAPSAGDKAFALEVPGTVFFLKPIGGDGNLIPMVPAGTCPTSDMSLSWAYAKVQSSWQDTYDSFGGFTYTASSSTGTVVSNYKLDGTTASGSNSPMSATCSNGIMSVTGADLFLNQAGGAIVHVSPTSEGSGGDAIIVGMAGTSGVNGASAAGTYAGLVFDTGKSSGSQDFPVTVTLTAAGSSSTGTGKQLTDVTTGATSSGGATLTLNGAGAVAGSILGTIDTGHGASNMACVLQTNAAGSGHNVMVCDSEDSPGGSKFFSIILTSI